MGSPKKQRKKFSKPSHPWQKERILAEQELLKSYGLRRKYEIWKMNSILKNFTRQAKNLITIKTLQTDKEKSQLLTKLSSLGLIESGAKMEDVLSLTLTNVMERRLQTLVYKKNMAKSLTQARQFIVHEHISIGDKKITSPSYIVPLNEEVNIQFIQSSPLIDPNHAERTIPEVKKESKTTKETEKKQEEKESKQEKKVEKKVKKKETKAEAKEQKQEDKENKKTEKKETKAEAKEKQG